MEEREGALGHQDRRPHQGIRNGDSSPRGTAITDRGFALSSSRASGSVTHAESERTLLQKARRALQAKLEGIKLDTVDTNKGDYQKLQLKKQDLERSLEEQEDRVGMAFDRMKRAEAHANECQVELDKIRVENSELDRLDAKLEKHIKELNVRIVNFETKSYGTPPRPSSNTRRLEIRAYKPA